MPPRCHCLDTQLTPKAVLMVDEVIQIEDDFLWPSPEMRKAAIERATKMVSERVANSIEEQIVSKIQAIIAVATEKVEKDFEGKIRDLTKKLDNAKELLEAVRSMNFSDIDHTVNQLRQEMNAFRATSASGLPPEYASLVNTVRGLAKLVCSIKTKIEQTKFSSRVSELSYKVTDYDLRNKIAGKFIAEDFFVTIDQQLSYMNDVERYANLLPPS